MKIVHQFMFMFMFMLWHVHVLRYYSPSLEVSPAAKDPRLFYVKGRFILLRSLLAVLVLERVSEH